MTAQLTRGRVRVAALALGGMAVTAIAGERYFTRLTIIYTGNRGYRAGGRLYQLSVTATDPLSAEGGA